MIQARAFLRDLDESVVEGVCRDAQRLELQAWLAGKVCESHGVEVEHVGSLPAGELDIPAVVVASHVSYIDPLALCACLPAFAIAKREVASWPVLGSLAQHLGMVPYRRGDAFDGAQVLQRCARYVRSGYRVLAFPEGTTSPGHVVGRFQRGMFFLARWWGVPVLPVAIRYESRDAAWVGDATFVPHDVRTAMRPRTRVQLEFLPPLEPHAYPSEDALAAAARRHIEGAIRS
ncbi:MAG: lysophospholipid acyltransferase family protein [Myxococcota bacterium]